MKKDYVVLNHNSQFQNAYRSGKSFVSPLVVMYLIPRRRGGIRYGITASKKIGCAVLRNRARRVVRAAAIDVLSKVSGSFDFVFVCRKATASAKSHQVAAILYRQLVQAGAIVGGASS